MTTRFDELQQTRAMLIRLLDDTRAENCESKRQF
jgi:hypothetical protein